MANISNSPAHYPTVVINGRAPFFDGNNFNLWKVRFKCYLQSLGPISYDAITKDYYIESNVYNAGLDENLKAKFIADGKVKDALLQSLNNVDLERVINCNSAFKMWKVLEVTHEGSENVKLAKKDQLMTLFEKFHMLENESIDDMFNRFCHITNGLASLGEEMTDDKKVRKILRSLTPKWQIKATTLREVNDVSKLTLDVLQGSLKTHELELAEQDERVPEEKKKSVAFKTTTTQDEASTDDEEIDLDELALFTKRMSKFFKRRGKMNNTYKGDRRKVKSTKEREPKGACYICDKLGHFAANCPMKTEKSSAQNKEVKGPKENKFAKRRHHKANLAATWDDSEGSDSDQSTSGDEVANVCFMAHTEKPREVKSFQSFPTCFMALEDTENDDDISLEEALLEYEKLFKIHLETKKRMDYFKKKYESFSIIEENLKNERDLYKDKYEQILKEVDIVKTRVDSAYSAMKAFDTQKFITMYKTLIKGKFIAIEPVIVKKKVNESKHASTSKVPHVHKKNSHAHFTHYAHNKSSSKHFKHGIHKNHHAHLYTPMTCDFCGRKGHIEKFCYDKIGRTSNKKNQFIWKRTTNVEPKDKGVPKFSVMSAGHIDKGGT